MKKLFFYGILILVFLASCAPDFEEEADNPQPPDSPDQKITNITVYLDGYEPPAQSRAINKPFALMNCDYFEVIFLYNGTAVRGQWRIGEKAGVNGVTRGINYGNVTSSPTAGQGSAILLAGKSDKTIMAIGRLPSGTIISADTTSVTFQVAAVKAGVTPASSDVSGFFTAAKSLTTNDILQAVYNNTEIVNENIATYYFPAFKLPTGNPDIKARYKFILDASSVSFSNYTAALSVSSDGTAYKKQPSYSMNEGGNINGGNAVPYLDIRSETTVVSMINNKQGNTFDPDVQFKFDTANPNQPEGGSLFALVFQIPVSVLVPGCVWYIRPSYGVLNYELDDATGGLGGAVLIKIGDAALPAPSSNEFKIKVMKPPGKWRYRWTAAHDSRHSYTAASSESGNSTDEYDRVFRIGPLGGLGGLEVQKFNMSDGVMNDFVDGGGNQTNVIPYNNLTFIIGNSELPSTAATGPNNYVLPDEFYGLIEITVKHTNSAAISATDKFYILASGNYVASVSAGTGPTFSTTDYDYANLDNLNTAVNDTGVNILISDANGLVTYFNSDPVNTIRIVRLSGSFDMAEVAKNTNSGESRLYMFVSVADNNNLVLGRSGSGNTGAQYLVRGRNSGLTAFFFGLWPFDGLRNSPANLNNKTKNFKINAGGSYATPDTISINSDRKMITDGDVGSGGIYNVDLGKGITVNAPLMLH